MPLQFDYTFGFRNSVAFYDPRSVIFGAGKLCLMLELASKQQSCFQFGERAEISSLRRCGTLVAAAIRGRSPSVCLFNTLSDTKKLYAAPGCVESEVFTCLSVSVSLKFVAAQGGAPDWTLAIWFTHSRDVAATFHPLAGGGTSVNDISFHGDGQDELVVVGENVFRLYEYQDEEEASFVEHVFEKYETSGEFYSIAWPQKENLAVSNARGEILYFRGIELIHEMSVADDVLRRESSDLLSKAVTCIAVTSRHLLCVYAGRVLLMYGGEGITSYTFLKWIYLTAEKASQRIAGELKPEMDVLDHIVLGPDEKDVVGTTRQGQLLYCRAFADGDEPPQFVSLIHASHNQPVTGIDVARSRPVLATCSQNAFILFNCSNREQELRKIFKAEILSVALHPSGLYLGLGFDICCRIFSVLHGGLRERALLRTKSCRRISFSPGGHLLAAASGAVIHIYSFGTCTLAFKLLGHAGPITSVAWKDSDCRLVSCDARGVLSEWDLLSRSKTWEHALVTKYISVDVNFLNGDILAVASDKSVRCFSNAGIQWTLDRSKELTSVVASPDGEMFYVGTVDGCIESHSFPASEESLSINAHGGGTTQIKYSIWQDCLISAGSDGSVFVWATNETKTAGVVGVFSGLALVDRSSILEQEDRIKQLRIALQHTNTCKDCEFELNSVRHAEMLRKMALDHTDKVDQLNNEMARVKEEMQTILYDADPEERVEMMVQQEILDTTTKLNEVYRQSNDYFAETEEILLTYESEIDTRSKEHAKFSCSERNAIEKIIEKIKGLEQTLVLEKGITKETLLACEEYRRNVQRETSSATDDLTNSMKAMLGEESDLQVRIGKMKQLIEFKSKDSQSRRDITSGQVDFDIEQKMQAVTLLKKEFLKLETAVESKEKMAQNQEKKFCELRKSVGGFQKCHSVSKTAAEELVEDIRAKESEIEFCRAKINEIANCIPRLEEEMKLTEDLHETVTEKERETVEGYNKKKKMLRDMRDVISRYTFMLGQCFFKAYNSVQLTKDILNLFEESRIGIDDETTHSDVRGEYDFQVHKLKSSYEVIKSDPSKSMRDKSMAEFRLSQENSKILREVRELQRDNERLSGHLQEMEIALGVQADELRGRIEFVVAAGRTETVRHIERLDSFIEEQQREIARFKTMLSAKQKGS